MKKVVLFQTAVIAALVLVVVSGFFGYPNLSLANEVAAQGNVSDEDQSPGTAQSDDNDDEVPSPGVSDDPEAVKSEPTTQVYFAPQDSNGTATVVILYNTTSVIHNVDVRAFRYTGALTVSRNVDVGPSSIMHLVSDSLAEGYPPSWDGSAHTKYTDNTSYATLAVSQGMKLDGYIVLNPGGYIDPNSDQGAISLRFRTDPLTVLLPAIQSGS
jgi:hypothetical protein